MREEQQHLVLKGRKGRETQNGTYTPASEERGYKILHEKEKGRGISKTREGAQSPRKNVAVTKKIRS